MTRKTTESPRDEGPQFLLGECEYALDSQRRLPLPWKHVPRFFLFPGRDQSLHLIPAANFSAFAEQLQRVSFLDSGSALALGAIGAMAQECKLDSNGRIMLSRELLDYAGIRQKATVVGALTTGQIWEPANWAQRRMDNRRSLDVLQAIQQRPDQFETIVRKALRPEDDVHA